MDVFAGDTPPGFDACRIYTTDSPKSQTAQVLYDMKPQPNAYFGVGLGVGSGLRRFGGGKKEFFRKKHFLFLMQTSKSL